MNAIDDGWKDPVMHLFVYHIWSQYTSWQAIGHCQNIGMPIAHFEVPALPSVAVEHTEGI